MQSNHLLYRNFPVEIRRGYRDLVQATDWHSRHEGLLNLAETALRYLASLSLSDYRSRCEAPVRNVETLLAKRARGNLTLGRTLGLFSASVGAIPDPLIPPPERFPDSRFPALRRFGGAIDALQAAVTGLSAGSSPAAIDVAVHVERGLAGCGEEMTWWGGWERLVQYRNKIAHAGSTRWPLRSEYWDLMGPLLHDALVELLTHPAVSEPVLSHPVVKLAGVSSGPSGAIVHAVRGEVRGAWLEEEAINEIAVTERWAEEHWKATAMSSYILEWDDEKRLSIRGLFWDLGSGLPPAVEVGEAAAAPPSNLNRSGSHPSTRRKQEGRGIAPGTCGEFAQGILPDGTPFHVTCPINKSSTVIAQLRAADRFSVTGLGDHHRKLRLAIEYAVELFDLGQIEVSIGHWSDLDIGKGMGSSTADVLAGIRAIADAVGEELEAAVEGGLAARVESSDGSMYPGIAAVNHKTCELVRAWDWYPEFVIVMLVPDNSVDTHSISFAGQEELADEYEDLLSAMDRAIAQRSIADFAAQSTRSAALNDMFLFNPYSRNLRDRLAEFDALGVSVGHTGSVCGLLFPNTESGRAKAGKACLELPEHFSDLNGVKVVTTPSLQVRVGSGDNADQADQADGADGQR